MENVLQLQFLAGEEEHFPCDDSNLSCDSFVSISCSTGEVEGLDVAA